MHCAVMHYRLFFDVLIIRTELFVLLSTISVLGSQKPTVIGNLRLLYGLCHTRCYYIKQLGYV